MELNYESFPFSLTFLDFFLLSVIAGICVYWLISRISNNNNNYNSNINSAFEPNWEVKYIETPSIVKPKNFIEKMEKYSRRMVVFYGSQTGTAEEFAGRLASEGACYGLRGVVADPEDTDMEDLRRLSDVETKLGCSTLAVFCMATYGEGDPTDNASEFYNWLQSLSTPLKGLNYAVFALGNKTYEHYNKFGIYVDERLSQCGASRICEIGLGDDDVNIEEDFVTWKERFWSCVCEEFSLSGNSEALISREYNQEILSTGEGDEYKGEGTPRIKVFTGEPLRLESFFHQRPPFDIKNPYLAPVLKVDNLFSSNTHRKCLHVELQLTESRIRYDAGDHVGIYPANDPILVQKLGDLLSLNLKSVFTFKPIDEDTLKKSPFPVPTTLETALTHYVDLTSCPRTHILSELLSWTQSPDDKKILNLLTERSPEGKAFYADWILKSHRTILHLLEDLPSCKPDIYLLLELLPRLKPRYYSISSSSKENKDILSITAVVVSYSTSSGRVNSGVCTSWLEKKIPFEDKIPLFIRRSTFRLPTRPLTPIIMIGPGTGVAPFRGFIHERALYKQENKPLGPTVLFYGCRNASLDYLYRNELETFQRDGLLTLFTAFSRDGPSKVYVTDLLEEQGSYIWTLLTGGAIVYICGDAKFMAKDVRAKFISIIETFGESGIDGVQYLKDLENKKRYLTDVWS